MDGSNAYDRVHSVKAAGASGDSNRKSPIRRFVDGTIPAGVDRRPASRGVGSLGEAREGHDLAAVGIFQDVWAPHGEHREVPCSQMAARLTSAVRFGPDQVYEALSLSDNVERRRALLLR